MSICDGTWDPSPEGLHCEKCDIERQWDEGPPYYHGTAGTSLLLTIELVPSTAWERNLRDLLTQSQWDTLRRQVYKQYNYHCGVCDASNTTMYCHEMWQYDDRTHTQKLIGLIALCRWCHHCKHLGFAGVLASRGELDYEQVIQHFQRVNHCSREVFDAHKQQAFATWRERSRHEWTLDLGAYASLIPVEQM